MANKLIVKYLDPNTGKYEFATVADIGDLDKLKTTVKTDIVSAINSIQLTGTGNNDALQQQLDEINKLLNEYGNNLTDEQKKVIEDLIGNISDNLEDRIKEVKDKAEEDRKTVADLITSVNSRFENAESDYIEKVNTINESLDDAKSSIENAKIELENTKNKLNTIDLNYIAVEKNIDEINGVLSTKVDSTEFDLLDSTVTQNTTDLIQTKKDISLKANQASLDLVTDRVQKAEASLEITAGQIQQKVTYSEMQDELEKVGKYGKNLLKGTRNWKNWISSDLLKATVTINDYRHCKIAEFSTRNSYFEYILDEDIEVGETYVASINFKSEIEDNLVAVDFHEENNIYPLEEVVEDVSTLNGWKRMFVKFVATDPNPVVSFRFSFLPNGAVGYMSAPKLEKGSKATDWESNSEDDNNAIVEANSIIKQNADSIIQAVEKIEKNQDDIVETNSRIDITNENIELQTQRIEDIGGEVKETKANLEITSNAIKTKVSQTDVDKSISDIHIDNKNRILNSDFSRDFENWNENGGFQLKTINDINYAYISRKGTSAENIVSIASDKFKVDYGARLIFGFDIFVENLSEYDIRTPIILEIFDINDIRVDMQKFSLESLNGSIEQGVSSRLNGFYKIDREDASKARVRLCLNKNGSIGFSRIIFQAGDINSTDWSAAPEDSQIIQSKLETAIDQTVDQIKLSATKEELNKVNGKVEGSIAELKIASDSIETLVSDTKDNTTRISKLTQKSDEFSVLIGEMDEDLGVHENEIAQLKISKNEIDIGISSVQESLQVVENNVNRTQELVDKANNTILEMSKDTILSSIEKTITSKEWSTIKSDYLLVKAQGEKYDVDINSLNAKYSALSSYITPILANMNSNSTIVPSTFQLNFKNYYDEKLNVLNKVNDKINKNIDIAKAESITASKTYTDSQISVKSDEIELGVKTVTESINKVSENLSNLSIGGRNLQLDTFNFSSKAFRSLTSSTIVTKETTGSWVEVITGATSTELNFVDIGENQQFTVSFDCMTTNTVINSTQMMLVQYFNSSGTRINYEWVYGSYGNSWKRFNLTSTTPAGTTKIGLGFRSTANLLRYRLVKLELGNKATAWTPALEDSKLYTSWSNDPNGADMVRVYPNENLALNTEFTPIVFYRPVTGGTTSLNSILQSDGWHRISLRTDGVNSQTEILPVPNRWYTLKSGVTYTQSILVRTDATYNSSLINQFSWFTNEDSHNRQNAKTEYLGNNIYRISGSLTPTKEMKLRLFDSYFTAFQYHITGTYIDFKYGKLEIGSEATAWTSSPTEDPVKAEMAYVGYSPKDSSDPSDYTWSENSKAKGTFKRWANSSDGKVDFTRTYPNENLIYNGKGNEKKGIFTNFDSVTDEYAKVSLTSAKVYTNKSVAEGFELDLRDYKVGEKVTWSYDFMYDEWNMPTGTVIGELWLGQRYGSPAWTRVTQHDLPRVGQNGIEKGVWYKNTFTMIIPDQPDASVTSKSMSIQFYNGGDTTASFSIRMKNVKLEYGDKATPFISNQADNTPLDSIPKYVGIGAKDSDNPADFVWSENPRVAEISSEIANNSITEMSKDSVLSAVEKGSVAKEWATIQSDYPLVKAQGLKYGTSLTTLNSTYSALSSYITPLLANMTQNSDIVPATFRLMFKNYYDAKLAIMGDVNDVINVSVETSKNEAITTSKTYTDSAIKIAKDSINIGVNELNESVTKVTRDLNELSVGARNYLLGTSTSATVTGDASTNQTTTSTNYTFSQAMKSFSKSGDKFIFSATVTVTGSGFRGTFRPQTASGYWAGLGSATSITKAETIELSIPVTINQSMLDAPNTMIQFRFDNIPTTVKMTFTNVKFEKGTKQTDWSPAPEEVDKAISTSLETSKTYTDSAIKIAKDSIDIGVNETSETVKSITTSISKLVNMFPDPDLKKQTPKPTVESGVTATYDASGLVISNTGTAKARAYWGVAPISLTIGKTYTVKAYVNSGGSGDIEIGSAGGENISATTTNSNPFWLEGSIKCTNYTAFSIYVQAGKSFRIRELYVYEGSGVTNQEILNSFEASKTYADARIKVTKEALDLNVKNVTNTVTKVADDLSNLSISGTNMITDSTNMLQSKIAFSSATGTKTLVDEAKSPTGKATKIRLSANTSTILFYLANGKNLADPTNKTLLKGEIYTLSMMIRADVGFGGNGVTINDAEVISHTFTQVTTEYKRVSVTFKPTTNSSTATNQNIHFFANDLVTTVGNDIYIHSLQLEKGNIATSWTPAPEDAKLYTAWSNDPNGKDMIRVYPNENLVNMSTTTLGQYMAWNGDVLISNVSRAVTDYIPVKQGSQYILSLNGDMGYSLALHLFKNNDGSRAELRLNGGNGVSSWDTPDGNGATFGTGKITPTIPSGYNYARISIIKSSDTITAEILKALQIKMELGTSATTYTPSPQDDPVKAEMAYIGYSPKDSNDPADYVWSENPKVKATFKRWSNDPNGLVDMTATYPNENLLLGTSKDTQSASASGWFDGERATNATQDPPQIDLNKKYTYSAYLTAPSDAEVYIYVRISRPGASNGSYEDRASNRITSGNSGLAKVTFELPSDTTKVQFRVLRFSPSQTTAKTISWSREKLELGSEVTTWVSNQEDDPLNAIPQYVGIGSKDTMNPADFVWSVSPEYTQALNEVSVKEVQFKLTPDSIYGMVGESSEFIAWQDAMASKPSIDDLMNVQDQLDGLSDADETILASVADLEIANNGVLTTLNTAVREMDGTLNTISDYMFFGKSSLTGTVGLTIGKSDSNMKVNIANDEMGFYDNETRIAWINSQQLNITSAVIQNDIKVGNHLIEKFNDAEQITIVRYIGS